MGKKQVKGKQQSEFYATLEKKRKVEKAEFKPSKEMREKLYTIFKDLKGPQRKAFEELAERLTYKKYTKSGVKKIIESSDIPEEYKNKILETTPEKGFAKTYAGTLKEIKTPEEFKNRIALGILQAPVRVINIQQKIRYVGDILGMPMPKTKETKGIAKGKELFEKISSFYGNVIKTGMLENDFSKLFEKPPSNMNVNNKGVSVSYFLIKNPYYANRAVQLDKVTKENVDKINWMLPEDLRKYTRQIAVALQITYPKLMEGMSRSEVYEKFIKEKVKKIEEGLKKVSEYL